MRYLAAMRPVLFGRCCLVAAALAVPPGVSAQHTAAVAEVEAHELAFAKTMADRDLAAFLTFISPEAVFFSGEQPLRGRDAIERGWAPFFDGPDAPFSWRPDVVEVLESGDLALTSGPVMDPGGTEVGRFNTVWRRNPVGEWRVVFDKGS